jgi:hypothetical protein
VDDLHPANAGAIAEFAEETGARVLCGAIGYPSESGGWQLGDLDLSEHLAKYHNRDLVVVIASAGRADEVEQEKYVCGICGFALSSVRARAVGCRSRRRQRG